MDRTRPDMECRIVTERRLMHLSPFSPCDTNSNVAPFHSPAALQQTSHPHVDTIAHTNPQHTQCTNHRRTSHNDARIYNMHRPNTYIANETHVSKEKQEHIKTYLWTTSSTCSSELWVYPFSCCLCLSLLLHRRGSSPNSRYVSKSWF